MNFAVNAPALVAVPFLFGRVHRIHPGKIVVVHAILRTMFLDARGIPKVGACRSNSARSS